MTLSNFDLKEEIRAYWTARADTFDLSPGHLIRTDRELQAYARLIRTHAPSLPGRAVMDAASGTGEVTRLLRHLGCEVTGIDLSERMVELARAKHAGDPAVQILQGDAERLMLPDGGFNGIVCRNLIWTLTNPDAAFSEWFRVLKRGGTVVAFEGNWINPDRLTLALRAAARRLGKRQEDGASEAASILSQLPFRGGMPPEDLGRRMVGAGFETPAFHSIWPVTWAQMAGATLAERLSLLSYTRGRIMMVARRPVAAEYAQRSTAA